MSVRAPVGDPSKRPLSEVARHLVVPTGIVDSVWFDLEERFDEWNVRFDTWQDGAGQLMLGTRADGRYASTVGGCTWSIPRQVAKTFIVSRTSLGLASYTDDMTILWTAHRVRTATQTFQKMAAFAQSKRVKPYLEQGRSDGIRTANGEQEIRLRNGSRILFGARENGFGRGFDEVDIEVFDEAQILTERSLEDMVPATNQSRSPHGALLIFMGTPPRPVDPGEVLTARRREALAAKPDEVVVAEHGDAMYLECSADSNVGLPGGPNMDDEAQIRKANPSYPHRTPPESIARMWKNLPSDEARRREALGVWDRVDGSRRLVTVKEWSATGVSEPPADGVRSFGVAFSADGKRVSVGGSVKHPDGFHVELVAESSGEMSSGIASLASWLAERWRDTAQITISGRSHADVLRQALIDEGVSKTVIRVASTQEYLAACAMTYNAIVEREVTHLAVEGQAALDESVAVSDKKVRSRDGGWGWEATTADGDETPVEAVSLALWGSKTSKRKPGRKAQVML